MANVRLTLGTVLGTVETTALTVTKGLGAVSRGVSVADESIAMLEAWVKDQRQKQTEGLKGAAKRHRKELALAGTRAEADMERSAREYRSRSPEDAEAFDRLYEEYAILHGVVTETNTPHLKVAAE